MLKYFREVRDWTRDTWGELLGERNYLGLLLLVVVFPLFAAAAFLASIADTD